MADLPVKKTISRKSFLYRLAGFAGTIFFVGYIWRLWNKKEPDKIIPGKILGANHKTGHKIRSGEMPEPTKVSETNVLIVGGGIAGLSAARWLTKNGVTSIRLLELDNKTGGNAAFGENAVSSYPWGAHYLPIPSTSNTELIEFLEEHKVIIGYENGLPVYDEFYICHSPEERLFIHGHWQEGLVPSFGVPDKDKKQIERFFEEMNTYRGAIGKDGKQAFALPIDQSSKDETYTSLDKISFREYLNDHRFDSPYLLWYAEYCCRDDYGTLLSDTSAWAGIHYFACRKGKAVNADYSDVLTWPNGNGWLAEKLKQSCANCITTQQLAYSVKIENQKVVIDTYNSSTHQTERIIADKCIMATPQYVNQYLLKSVSREKDNYAAFSYSPWMVANIHVKKQPSGKGADLSWDNVFYGKESLGYVNASNQKLDLFPGQKMLTYYLPLTQKTPQEARKEALEKTHQQWMETIVKELKVVHPQIENDIVSIDVWLWGHGMIRPTRDFIWGEARTALRKPIEDKIYFAHSDLGGISIFEEAFYQGIEAAKNILVNV